MNKKFWQLMGLIIPSLAFLFSYMDRLSWAPIISIVTKEIEMTATQVGSYMSAFFMGYVIAQLPGGILTDRFGYRKVLLASFCIMGAFTASMGTIHSYEQGFILRVGAGLGSGAIFSAGSRAIFDWFTDKNRGLAMGIFSASTNVGLVLVNLLVPLISTWYGWRYSFFACGFLPLMGFVLGLFLLRENKGKEIKDTIIAEKNTSSDIWNEILNLFKNRNLVLGALAGFCAIWATAGTSTWSNAYMVKQMNVSAVVAGAIMSTYGIGAALSPLVIGFLADRLKIQRKYVIGVALFCFAPALIVFGLNTNVNAMYFLAPLLGFVAISYYPILTLFLGESVKPHQIGTALGFSNTVWQGGAMLSPIVVGMAIDVTQSYTYAFPILAAGPFLAAFIILMTRKEQSKID